MQKEKNLLKRFLQGKASEKEIEDVEGWIDKSIEENNEWSKLSEEGREDMIRDMWKGIHQTIDSKKRSRKKNNNKLFWAAAALILLLMIPLYYLWEDPFSSQQLGDTGRLVTVATATGEIKEIVLNDGSKVWLNAQSQLSYSEKFEGKTRDVNLIGQAYFDIMRNVRKPFVVRTQTLNIKVLGTRFDISDYQEDGSASVAVLSGKVAVLKSDKSNSANVLDKGERLKLDKRRQSMIKEKFKPSEFPAWVNKEVVFYHTTMDQVANFVRRNYNMKVLFSNKQIGKLEVSGDFGEIDNMENLLSMICLTINAHYKISGNEVAIKLLD